MKLFAAIPDGAAVPGLALGVSGALALASWTLPNHEWPWTSFHAEVAMSVAGCILALRLAVAERTAWRLSAAAAALLVLAGAAAVRGVVGDDAFIGPSALAATYLLGAGLGVLCGLRAAERWGSGCVLSTFAALFVLGGLVSSFLALYQWFDLEYLGLYATAIMPGARVVANINQSNNLATLLVLGVVSLAVLWGRGRVGGPTCLAAAALFGMVIAASGSRTAWIELAIVAAVMLGKRVVLAPWLSRRSLLALPVAALAGILAWHAWQVLATGTSSVMQRDADTRAVRIHVWEMMLDAVIREPYAGYGWNATVKAQFATLLEHPPTSEVAVYAHNLLVDLFVWNGLIVGTLACAGLVWWLGRSLRRAATPAAVLALAVVSAVLAHAMLEYPLYYAYFLLPVCLLVGLVEVDTQGARWSLPHGVVSALLALAVGVLGVLIHDYLGIERDIAALRFEQARIQVDDASRVRSRPLMLTHLGGFVRFADMRERPGMSAAELEGMVAVVERFPSPPNLVKAASAFALNGQPGVAEAMLRKACRVTSGPECLRMQRLWQALGARDQTIGAIPWPPP